MSRYYNIVIGAETSVQPGSQPASGNQGAVFTNKVNGQAVLSGQQVEFDITVVNLSGYYGVSAAGKITIRGVSILQIAQSMDFNGAPITVYAGMQNGLPLANAQAIQAGVILQGTIQSAYGNWIGVEQSLEFIVMPPDWPTQVDFANLTVTWVKGDQLQSNLINTLKIALPTYSVNINISPNLVFTQTVHGVFQTLEQFSSWVNQVSLDILSPSNPNYTGVQISVRPNKVLNIVDNVAQTPGNSKVKALNAPDFIGQPTWLQPNTIQFNTVMRSDIAINDYISFPTVLSLQLITNQNSQAYARQNPIFQGIWLITLIRHLGNSRGPNALDWITTFQAVSVNLTSTQASSGNTSA